MRICKVRICRILSLLAEHSLESGDKLLLTTVVERPIFNLGLIKTSKGVEKCFISLCGIATPHPMVWLIALHGIIRSPTGSSGSLFLCEALMTSKSNVAQKVPSDIALIVYGLRNRKQHASRFGSATAQSAQEAAKTMGLRSLRVVNDAQREIARRLPKGTVSPKGRTVVPLVRPALYNKLLEIAGTEGAPSAPPSSPPAAATKKPAPAAEAKADQSGGGPGLTKGTVVLAKDDPDPTVGWFEAVIMGADGDTVTLQWKSWPELPKFTRKLTQLAQLHVNATKPC